MSLTTPYMSIWIVYMHFKMSSVKDILFNVGFSLRSVLYSIKYEYTITIINIKIFIYTFPMLSSVLKKKHELWAVYPQFWSRYITIY